MDVIKFLTDAKSSSSRQFFSFLTTRDLLRLAKLLNIDLPSKNRRTVMLLVFRTIQARKEIKDDRQKSS